MTQQEALDILKLGHNIYLTGSAGSGKTYVLNQFIEYLRSHDVDVGITASTGIAATHLGGMTIHSWSGLGIKADLSSYELEALEEKRYLWNRLEHTKVLIIDEVSMLHHFRLDLIDQICRMFKRRDVSFGGMQVVLSGDFFQLPPVARAGEPDAKFIYESKAWQGMNLKICYLHEQFRQKDPDFLKVLQAIRTNSVANNVLDLLRKRYKKKTTLNVKPTRLFTHNIDVDEINNGELHKLPGEIHAYTMQDDGHEHIVESLKKSCLAPERLELKLGAQVMFVKNNYDAGYVNGTRGTVVGFSSDDVPIVETLAGRKINAEPVEWQIAEEGKMLATISQVPLRLAWAITVHKSQGMSLDAVEVDLSKSFELGMGYVALSRVRALDGLTLLGLNEIALKVNPDVLIFDKKLQEESAKVAQLIKVVPEDEIKKLQTDYLEFIKPKSKEKKSRKKKTPNHLVTKTLIEAKKPLSEIAKEQGFTIGTIIHHIEKCLDEGQKLEMEYLKEQFFTPAQFTKITDAFKVSLKHNPDFHLAPIKAKLDPHITFDQLKLARLFLKKGKTD